MKNALKCFATGAGTLAGASAVLAVVEYAVLRGFFPLLIRIPSYGVSKLDVLDYFARNVVADFTFLVAVAVIVAAITAAVARLRKRRYANAGAYALGVPGAALLYVLTFVPINGYYLPYFLSTKSILLNAGLVFVFVCLEYLMYRLARFWLDRVAFKTPGRTVQALALGLLIASIFFVLVPPPRSRASEEGASIALPNVLILVFDALRADALSCYGSPFATPNFDGFAAGGYCFENAYACAPNTWRSVPTLYTSQYPTVHGCRMTTAAVPRWRTLAEVLGGSGYYCAAVTGNEVMRPSQGFNRGFAEYVTVHELRAPAAFNQTVFADFYRRACEVLAELGVQPRVTDLVTARVRKFIDESDGGRPFFIYVHYMDPHGVYTPPAEYVRGNDYLRKAALELLAFKVGAVTDYRDVDAEVLRTLYLGEVAYVDAALGEILTALDRSGLRDDTIIIITADHGEEFGEHGTVGGHYTHYREVIRVPLLVKAPSGPLAGPGRYAGAVSLVDVAPTIYAAAGVEPPPDLEGVDLASLVATPDPDRFVYSEGSQIGDEPKALHSARYTVIENRDEGKIEVYDRATDPGEQRNIYEAGSNLTEGLLAKLRAEYEAVEEKAWRGGEGEEIELSTSDKDKLRGLGYF